MYLDWLTERARTAPFTAGRTCREEGLGEAKLKEAKRSGPTLKFTSRPGAPPRDGALGSGGPIGLPS